VRAPQLSLSHSDGVAKSQIERFMRVVEKACAEIVSDGATANGATHAQIAVPVLESVNMCDLKEETVETLLSLLEEVEFGNYLLVDGSLSDRCIITLKKRSLEALAAANEHVCQAILKCGVNVKDGDANKQLEEWGGTAQVRAGANASSLVPALTRFLFRRTAASTRTRSATGPSPSSGSPTCSAPAPSPGTSSPRCAGSRTPARSRRT
jgi:hypothetical protein